MILLTNIHSYIQKIKCDDSVNTENSRVIYLLAMLIQETSQGNRIRGEKSLSV
jgi:hypothetical protein